MIPDRWYPILESRRLRRRPVGLTRLGQKLVLWRNAEGEPVAQSSACPHRGAALEHGRVIEGELACPWHGFRFASNGQCTRMPCEGREARIPRAMSLATFPVREAFGLVWLWWGEAVADLPPIAYFDEVKDDTRTTADASYELPYHYSRMVETNLDIHHTPFVHGSVFPVGERVDPFEASIEGDHIRTWGELRREGRQSGFAFRAETLLPCLGLVELGTSFRIIASATPVDENRTWMWFRYHSNRIPGALGRLASWIAVQSELRVVQRQDWRIFAAMAPGSIDDVPYRFVGADKGIALYRKRRAELLADERHARAS